MADTYTTRNRITKPETGAYVNTWGTVFAEEVVDLLDFALDGITSVAISGGNKTLTNNDGATDQARARVLVVSSSDQHDRQVIVPALEKVYLLDNQSDYRVVFLVSGETGFTVLPGTRALAYCDAADFYKISRSGWGLLKTQTPDGDLSTTVSLAVTGEQFSDCMILVNEGTLAASGDGFTITPTGSSGGTSIAVDAAVASTTFSAFAEFTNYKRPRGRGVAGTTVFSGGRGAVSDAIQFQWRDVGATGITSVDLVTGENFTGTDAIEVYLR